MHGDAVAPGWIEPGGGESPGASAVNLRRLGPLVLLAATSWCSVAAGTVLQVDVRPVFNADLVVNDGTGVLDPTQDPIDLGTFTTDNFCFPTASAALRLAGVATPDGVPDDALFPADAYHPDVQLWWRNDDDGRNGRRTAAAIDRFTLDVPVARYTELHLFATSGDGDSVVTVTVEYDDLTSAQFPFTVPDWFDDLPLTQDSYRLIDGRDRVQVGSGPGIPYEYQDRNDPAIFGQRLVLDPGRTVASVIVDRTDTTGVLDFFGAVAVTVPAGPDLYESTLAQGLEVPANIVQTGVASPIDHAPALASLLFYSVSDGAGFPALIYLAKGGSGLLITF